MGTRVFSSAGSTEGAETDDHVRNTSFSVAAATKEDFMADPKEFSYRNVEYFASGSIRAFGEARLRALMNLPTTFIASPGESIFDLAEKIGEDQAEHIVIAEDKTDEGTVVGIVDVQQIIERCRSRAARPSQTLLQALQTIVEELDEEKIEIDEEQAADGRITIGWCAVGGHFTVLPCREHS